MPFGFYIIMAAQFFPRLPTTHCSSPPSRPYAGIEGAGRIRAAPQDLLHRFYVVLAAFVGAFADSMPKWRVMFISNTIKILGCGMMFFAVHPLSPTPSSVGGAAAYSPAKYGILTEYPAAPPARRRQRLDRRFTVGAIILGVVIGGTSSSRTSPAPSSPSTSPLLDTGIDTVGEMAISIVGILYVLAAIFNLYIPETDVDHKP